MTHRVHLDDPPEVILASEWEYTDASLTAICLLPAGTSFVANDNMVKDRLMLCEDADDQIKRLVQEGLGAGVPPPNGDLPPLESQHCHEPPHGG